MLHARQLGLKLIANTTFGYTAASYSGRMPCIEVCIGFLYNTIFVYGKIDKPQFKNTEILKVKVKNT